MMREKPKQSSSMQADLEPLLSGVLKTSVFETWIYGALGLTLKP